MKDCQLTLNFTSTALHIVAKSGACVFSMSQLLCCSFFDSQWTVMNFFFSINHHKPLLTKTEAVTVHNIHSLIFTLVLGPQFGRFSVWRTLWTEGLFLPECRCVYGGVCPMLSPIRGFLLLMTSRWIRRLWYLLFLKREITNRWFFFFEIVYRARTEKTSENQRTSPDNLVTWGDDHVTHWVKSLSNRLRLRPGHTRI